MIATSRHAHLRRFGAWTTIVLALLVMALAGCGGDNGVGPKPPGPPQYLTSSTPQNVLTNLKLAYERRDSTAYDSLFDVSYVGTSFDPSNLNTITFSKADEKRHVQALERTTSITSVSLTFSPVLIRGVDGADPPGWATISMQNMTLEINDTPTSQNLVPNVTWEFTFAPTTPSAGSPTDTTWHIVRWTELP